MNDLRVGRGPAALVLIALAAYLFLTAWLARLERNGPNHADLMLEGDVPATFYLPAGVTAWPTRTT